MGRENESAAWTNVWQSADLLVELMPVAKREGVELLSRWSGAGGLCLGDNHP